MTLPSRPLPPNDAAPRRIQRRRTKGWRMPEGAVYVGRPTAWGNPNWMPGKAAGRHDGTVFVLGWEAPIMTRAESVAEYRMYALMLDGAHPEWLEPLRGHDLACWCPLDQPCHADVLLELANRP